MSLSRAILLFLVFGQLGCAQLSKWRTEKAERRTLVLDVVWSQKATKNDIPGFRKINRMSPILFNDKKYGELLIQGNAVDGVAAYERSTGREIWRLDITNGIEASGSIVNDRLFVGALDGQMYSINASTGQVLWTFATRMENLSEPLLDDGVLYFLNGSGSLYALEADSGKQLWVYSRQDTSALSVRGGSKPAIKNGMIFVGYSDGYLVAINAKTGALKWEQALNRNKRFKDVDSNPVVDGDNVYVTGFDDKIYSLKTSSGDINWKADKGGYGKLLISGERLFYAATAGEFIALDKATGKKVWSTKVSDGIATGGVIYRGFVIFGESQGELRIVDSGTGRSVASFDPGRGVFATPTVDEKTGSIFFISGEANLYSLQVKWSYQSALGYLR